jgi:hypothetical protein
MVKAWHAYHAVEQRMNAKAPVAPLLHVWGVRHDFAQCLHCGTPKDGADLDEVCPWR